MSKLNTVKTYNLITKRFETPSDLAITPFMNSYFVTFLIIRRYNLKFANSRIAYIDALCKFSNISVCKGFRNRHYINFFFVVAWVSELL